MIIGFDARELGGRPTGTGRYLKNLLREWVTTGQDTLVAFAPTVPETLTGPVREAVRAVLVGDPRSHGVVWQEASLPRAVASAGLDVFFSPAYHCPLRLAVPRVTAIHDLSFFSWPADFGLSDGIRRRLLTAASVRVSRRILTCSRFTEREVLRRFPAAHGRVLHVPLGPDDDLPAAPPREAARRALGLSGPFVLWVGSVFNRRCLDELLAALTLLRPRFPGLILDVVGDNRTEPQRDLRRGLLDRGLDGRVRLSGFVSELALAERYAAADVAVALSDYEGFGLPALEAQARDVPLIAADRPSLNEVVGDGALLVDPRSPAEIAAALAAILAHPGRAADLAARGRLVAARHSWAETARRTREALLAAVRP